MQEFCNPAFDNTILRVLDDGSFDYIEVVKDSPYDKDEIAKLRNIQRRLDSILVDFSPEILDEPISDENWGRNMGCNSSPDLFTGLLDETNIEKRKRTIAAKYICLCCPVIFDCARDAYQNPDSTGIRAGKTRNQRTRDLTRWQPDVDDISA